MLKLPSQDCKPQDTEQGDNKMAAYQNPQKSMLDWLIPSQLQSDITSPMLNIEDYY